MWTHLGPVRMDSCLLHINIESLIRFPQTPRG